MEADAALSLGMKIDTKSGSKIYIEAFITDDGSSLKAILFHDLTKNKTGTGKLPLHIPEPIWLADPSRRIRVVARKMFAFITSRRYGLQDN